MEFFTMYMGKFIDPKKLTQPIVMPSYLSQERAQNLLDLLISGIGNPRVLRINWSEDCPELDGNHLRIRNLILNTENTVLIALVENDQQLKEAEKLLPKVPSLLIIYFACARCGLEHHAWIYELKGLLVRAIELRSRKLFLSPIDNFDLAFPFHAFGDPLDVLDFFNARLSLLSNHYQEPKSTQKSFAVVLKKKMHPLSQEDLSLLIKLITESNNQKINLNDLDEKELKSLEILEREGFLINQGQMAVLRSVSLRLKDPNFLEQVVIVLGRDRLGKEGEKYYSAYMLRSRPSPASNSPTKILDKEMKYTIPDSRFVSLDTAALKLKEAGRHFGVFLSEEKMDLNHVDIFNMKEGTEERSLSLAIKAYLYAREGNFSASLEAATLASNISDQLKEFFLIIQEYIIGQYLYQGKLDDAIELSQAFLSNGGNISSGLLNLGIAYHKLGNNEKAFNFYKKALKEAKLSSDHKRECEAFLELGKISKLKGHWEKASTYFESARSIYRSLGDRSNEAWVLENLGIIYLNQDRFEDAIENFESALRIYQSLEDRSNEASIFMHLGIAYGNQNRYNKAIMNFKSAIRIYESLQDRYNMARAFGDLGITYRMLNKFEESIKYSKFALEIFRLQGDRSNEADVLVDMGRVYRTQKLFVEAMINFESALNIYRTLEDRSNEADALVDIGIIYRNQNRFDEAIMSLESALRIYRALESQSNEALTLGELGIVFRMQNNFDDAIKSLESALNIFRSYGDRMNEAWIFHNLGRVYRNQNRFDEAIISFESALSTYRSLGDRLNEAWVLGNLGLVQIKQNHLNEAIISFESALGIYRSLGDRLNEAWVLGSMGIAYSMHNNFEKAITNIESAISIYRSLGDQYNEGRGLAELAKVYLKQYRLDDAIKAVESELSIFRSLADRPDEALALNNLGILFRNKNSLYDAIESFKSALDIYQSLSDHYNTARVLCNLGIVYRMSNDFNEAIIVYKEALSFHSTLIEAHIGLAACYRVMNIMKEYKIQCKKIHKLELGENEYNFACIEAICGDKNKAINFLKTALEKKLENLSWAAKDPDFYFIKNDIKFRKLIESYS